MPSKFQPSRFTPHRLCVFTHGMIAVLSVVIFLRTISQSWVFFIVALGCGTFFSVLFSLLWKGEASGAVHMETRPVLVWAAVAADVILLGVVCQQIGEFLQEPLTFTQEPLSSGQLIYFAAMGSAGIIVYVLLHSQAVRRAPVKDEPVKV
ncbi:hypothetical protein QFZ75_007981 [Streptomyces sp. V3I8]|uniref:hypothetical protein n=1 Tax=Streptomyces sp. V3I8 TaxID=3042279 RepID=UPI00277E0874|nr:hypothetical protein [Streptomyces sp. V3I8]MDQ1041479.1 hypothetical protein [Streptomyces sp. V3I8]